MTLHSREWEIEEFEKNYLFLYYASLFMKCSDEAMLEYFATGCFAEEEWCYCLY